MNVNLYVFPTVTFHPSILLCSKLGRARLHPNHISRGRFRGGSTGVIQAPPSPPLFFSERALISLASLFLNNKSILWITFCLQLFSTSNNCERLMSAPLLIDMLNQDYCYSSSFCNIADQARSMPELSKCDINS